MFLRTLVYAAVLFGVQECTGYESNKATVDKSEGFLNNIKGKLMKPDSTAVEIPEKLIKAGMSGSGSLAWAGAQ